MISLVFTVWIYLLHSPVIQTGEVEEAPMLTGTASRYDYTLDINWKEVERSKNHRTCALRIYDRYGTYKVCSKATGECIECYHNDYWPKEYTNRVIDLSSYAFKQLWIPLSKGLAEVEIYQVK